MAKLLPPYIDKNCKSSAERLLFDIFKNSPFTEDWVILHSLNLSKHAKRLYGEIDFLMLIPQGGVFVLEVKGGDVKCANGVWQYKDRFSDTHTSSIGPFNQARDAMFSLLSAIEKEYGKGHRFTRYLFGFLCAFPHVNFDRHSVEYETWQILDKDIIQSNLELYFNNLIKQYILKYKNQKWFSEKDSLPGADDIELLCEFLRGDFERLRTIKERLGEFDQQVKSYTSEQYRVLDHTQINDRCIIQGSAGTGKTMIAIESALRAAQDGKSVFLTCFNRLIGEWMQNQLDEYKDRITTSGLHSFLFAESKGFDYDHTQSNKQEFYTKYIPALLKDIYIKGISKKFDKLIIDEGQDLIREEYLSLFDSMLNGGLQSGNWEIYGDFERQSIYGQLSKNEMFSLIEGYSAPAKFILKINCRNSKQIGEETSLLSGFEKPPFLLEYLEGIPVEYNFYSGIEHQVELLEAQLNNLKNKGLPFSEIMIISPKKLENSCCAFLSDSIIKEIRHTTDITSYKKCYNYATIHAYKGMESNYVIITDIEDLTSDFAKSILYVGMSRARYGLSIMISESLKKEYREILKSKLK